MSSALEALKAIGELKENGVKINTTEEYKIVENKLSELKEFVKVLCKMKIVDSNPKIYGINEKDIELLEKVMKDYD